jgi:hypothetical protein
VRAGEDAGAVSTVDCPDGVDTRPGPGLRALQAGFVQDQGTLVGVEGADDPIYPL